MLSIDRMFFDATGHIKPVVITKAGVAADPLHPATSASKPASGTTPAAQPD